MKTQKDHVDALFAKEDANVARKISVTKSAFTHPETMISKPQRTFALSLL